jgi:hypothetical protein
VINGEKFSHGMRIVGLVESLDGVNKKRDVLLYETTETDRNPRKVLRIIIPDKEGNVDEAQLTGPYSNQYAPLKEPKGLVW